MDYVGFDGEQFRNFRDVQDDRPLHMLNLVKFHETVTYPDGTVMSGRDAYRNYGRESALSLPPLAGALFGVGNNWPC
jgi:DNA-directed RNA polymerase alpha subunit